MTAYSEKLKDPRWQRKRLEVLEDRDFLCEMCGNGKDTLHVHHKEYLKGIDIWEYENDQLAVLCKDCHEAQHGEYDLLKFVCSFAPLDGPANREEIAFIVAAHIGIPIEKLLEKISYPKREWHEFAYEMGLGIGDKIYNRHLCK